MKKEKGQNQTPIIQKIEFDETTKEPIKIQLSGDEVSKPIETNSQPELNEELDITNVSSKQMVMKQVLGLETNSSVDKRQKILKNVLAVIFWVVVLAVLVFTAIHDFSTGEELPSWEKISGTFSKTWPFLLLALVALFFGYFSKGLKLTIMCKSITGKFHFKTCMETAVVGIYYNNVTPFAVGGQPMEIYHLAKHGVHGGTASSLPITTYFLNQLAFVVLGFTSVILLDKNVLGIPTEMLGFANGIKIAAIVGLSINTFLPLSVILFSLMPRFTSKLVAGFLSVGNKLRLIKKPRETTMKVYKTIIQNSRCIKRLASKPLVFISTFLLSFLEHLSFCSISYFVLVFFGYGFHGSAIDWLQVLILSVLLCAAVSFIPTPGNAGAADASFYFLFKNGLSTNGFTFPAMLSWRIISYYSTILIGFTFSTIKRRSDKKKKAKAQAEENQTENG